MSTLILVFGVIGFVAFTSLYGIQASRIRLYIKKQHPKLYSDKQLDGVSIMLGPPEVVWKAQLFILNKEYQKYPDAVLVSMCESAYRNAVLAFTCFCMLLATALWGAAVGS